MNMNYLRNMAFAFLTSAAVAAVAAPAVADGEIRKVDKGGAKLTIRHGELKELGMQPMTMVFQVADKAMLEQVKSGDKVHFTADRVNGALTITALETAK
jgi:Cu(I)/Ag(I) efflux system protein CusF